MDSPRGVLYFSWACKFSSNTSCKFGTAEAGALITVRRRGPQQGCPGGRRAMVKKVGKYEIGRTLGEGTFGKVKYAVNSETAERVAIKILDKERIQQQPVWTRASRSVRAVRARGQAAPRLGPGTTVRTSLGCAAYRRTPYRVPRGAPGSRAWVGRAVRTACRRTPYRVP
eukprot:scaffold55261_cov39-Phaeocystis_antarctica.AAC.1